ncbi:sodium/hydrogen exchanger family protein [Capsaspora owczarzaki ATCC 30864]|uniref:Sodium/hydrogen exchanger n=1 Tax=Capsaspora owczarzaki (strain ATCC 30864) TaxID=595528 RepID=A0A0D2WIB3_CAPO3|nr:sodium/hydrogen exchanger family protein [Capsaspora owczarzaki ATCC 30864]KJE89560.1 sodium/hydrogen exchanger family protein [Capsaspora owczarzaki ATCC 30864]|eukprot:XP_004365876.1 sodium/hydrogen exchanger family protein [Capsaspora owczarzaki ATCC 30864]
MTEEETLVDLEVASLLLFCVLVAFLVVHFNIRFLPESGATMLVGMASGAIARFALGREASFDADFFYYFLLPPIIFDAGYSLKRRDFFSNIGSILMYAVFGTMISTLVIGLSVYGITRNPHLDAINSTNPVDSLVFGSLLSATDPVATLSVLGSLNVDPLLYSLVFGEAVLNDAVSIVLFHSFLNFRAEDASVANVFKAIGTFVLVSVGSIAIGVAISLVAAFCMKRVDLRHHPYFETSSLLIIAYISFLSAEAAELSGLMALFFCGLSMAHYTFYNLSQVSRVAFGHTSKTLTFITETVVYLYLGLHAFSEANAEYHIGFIALTTVIVLFSRILSVFPLSFILNLFRKVRITFNMQCMMAFAGLRGAIAFSLALTLPSSCTETSCINNNAIVTTTMVIVLFTTLVLGCLTEPTLRILNIDRFDSDLSHDTLETMTRPDFDTDVSARHAHASPAGKKPRSRFHALWIRIDEKVMKPMFGGRLRRPEAVADSEAPEHRQSTSGYSPLLDHADDPTAHEPQLGDEQPFDVAPVGSTQLPMRASRSNSLDSRHGSYEPSLQNTATYNYYLTDDDRLNEQRAQVQRGMSYGSTHSVDRSPSAQGDNDSISHESGYRAFADSFNDHDHMELSPSFDRSRGVSTVSAPVSRSASTRQTIRGAREVATVSDENVEAALDEARQLHLGSKRSGRDVYFVDQRASPSAQQNQDQAYSRQTSRAASSLSRQESAGTGYHVHSATSPHPQFQRPSAPTSPMPADDLLIALSESGSQPQQATPGSSSSQSESQA